ncbi:hypothetical protein LJB86_01910 [Deltaproteobacteria bacterium OttesenSCG-928-M10]|nr:hypothetical protein [Deltaproteobacteria bacterium OttesenSCG-928-M10]
MNFFLFLSSIFLTLALTAATLPAADKPAAGLLLPAETRADSPPPEQQSRSLTAPLARFLGIPFRVDGAQDLLGRWVTFNQPDDPAGEPGFNCSGFTVAAARELLGRDFGLSEASRDRLGDSGPSAPYGQDWDFGLDLILNLAEDYPHRFLPDTYDPARPAFEPISPGRAHGLGVSLHSPAFEEQLARIQPGRFCFFTFSRPDRRFPAGVSYYHVGIIVAEGRDLWLYHTTAGAKTNRVNLADPEGLARLRRHFKPLETAERRVFMIEVIPPANCLR